jgi:hypothetical protein
MGEAVSGRDSVWSNDGGGCTGETYKQVVVKLTFFRGVSLDNRKKLFNPSIEGNTRRRIAGRGSSPHQGRAPAASRFPVERVLTEEVAASATGSVYFAVIAHAAGVGRS